MYRGIKSTLPGVYTCAMLLRDHTATLGAVLLFYLEVLPLRKRKNMTYLFTSLGLIVFYRSSISKNVFRKKVPASGIFLT